MSAPLSMSKHFTETLVIDTFLDECQLSTKIQSRWLVLMKILP